MLPSIFTNNMFDDMFTPFYGYRNNELMKADVKENKDNYELSVDLPGVKKEDVKVELKDGYLNISATTNHEENEKNNKGQYIRRERYSGSYSRSFYVGENVTQNDVKAKYENGTLKLTVPKKEDTPKLEYKKYIDIQ